MGKHARMADDDEHDHDLPLMSNSRDIHIHHYVLDLTCVFEEKRFKGSITLFCESQIPDEQSEKLVTTISKEQNDEKSGDDSGAASPHTLQNVLDQESIDKNLASNMQTETASELAASAVVDSLLFQQSTSRLFSVKQLHLYNTNDSHISCSPCEMPPFCDKESVVLTAETENKHPSSLVDHCYNSLEETQLHPNSSAEITTDLFLFPNSDFGSKIEFHSCQNSGTHISDCAEGPHELQIGTQTSSKPEEQLYSFKNSPIQTQIFCHDQIADASSEVHMLCNAGIETCSGIETYSGIETCSEEKICHNKDVDLHNITQVCHNVGGNLHVFTKIFQKSGMCSSSETKTCYLSGTVTSGKEQLCDNSCPDTPQVCHKLGIVTPSNDDSSGVDFFTKSKGFCTSGINKLGVGKLCSNMDILPPTETRVHNNSGVDSFLDTCATANAVMGLLAGAQECQNLGIISSDEAQVCCNLSLNLKMGTEVSHSSDEEVSGKGKLCHGLFLGSLVGAQQCHSIGSESSTEPQVYHNSGETMSDEAQVCYHSGSYIDTSSPVALCYISGIDTSSKAAVCHNTEALSSFEAPECYNSGTDTSESQSDHNFDAVHLAEGQVCDIKYVDKSNTTLASHELVSGPSSATVGLVSDYSSTHPVTKAEILGISSTDPVTKAEILGISSADSANQEHTYACQKLEKQSPICKTIMFTNNKNPHTASVDSPISNLMSHNSNFEILGKLELAPDKSINSHVTIDITDLHSAPKSEDVKASCSKQSEFELESTLEINSSHSTDFHLILDSWNILVDYVEEMVVQDSRSPMSQTHDELLQNHKELVQSCDLVAQECGELGHWSSLICKGNNVHVLGSDDFVHVNGKLVQKNYDNFVRFKDQLSQAKDETVRRNKEAFVGNEKLVKRNDEPVQLTKSEFSQETNDRSKRNDKILAGNNIIFRESNKHVKEGEKLDGGSDEQVKQNKRREISLIAVRKRLDHETSKNCIRICKPGVQHAQDFPRIIRIHFTTDPQGSSLKWTQDQDGNECVYTHGHWINNRSLFPSQDVPDTMATWEACIHVEPQYTVLMSGDKEPIVTTSRCGLKSYYYHTEMEMPSSTLALAVGKWKEIRLLSDEDIRMSDIETAKFYLPCRIFSPSSLQKAAQAVLGRYIPSCMEASASFLGPHPFKRLDILIVPYSFNSLGMASPSLMFLSQSILSADLMMCVRVAHEMSHSWFGLLIGPQDWTEEWLSEGFCTYTEEYIHCHIMKWNEEERLNHFGIRDYLKYRVLKAELHNTDEMFHILRPNKGQEIMLDGSTVQYVKNGMKPEKRYMQVHYLKGYFLLKHLEELVGIEDFHEFLLKFVQHFHGQLITSKDVLDLFFNSFSHHRLQGVSTESITQEWLDNPSIPKITCCELQEDNELAQHVLAQMKAFKEFGSEYKSLHWTKRRKKNPDDILSKLDGDQLVLFLEELLKEEHIHHHLLSCLRSYYSLHTSNADVLHRWCELVIKHKLRTNYQDVFWFLVNHQAMGVYLFGELVISEDSHQKKLAEACFRKIASDMDTDVRITVHSMLYGT